jgi:sulfur carrier protein
MTIELNGEAVELDDTATVAAVVERAGAGGDRRGVAVAVDGEVVPRSAWDSTELAEGQRVEVVGAIQGG